jgi:hypothetical protein
MPGFLHIFFVGTELGPYGKAVLHYQLTYSTGGNSYVRVFSEPGLEEFLDSDIGLDARLVEKAIEELRRTGKVTIADVGIRETELPAMGLEQLPSDAA